MDSGVSSGPTAQTSGPRFEKLAIAVVSEGPFTSVTKDEFQPVFTLLLDRTKGTQIIF